LALLVLVVSEKSGPSGEEAKKVKGKVRSWRGGAEKRGPAENFHSLRNRRPQACLCFPAAASLPSSAERPMPRNKRAAAKERRKK